LRARGGDDGAAAFRRDQPDLIEIQLAAERPGHRQPLVPVQRRREMGGEPPAGLELASHRMALGVDLRHKQAREARGRQRCGPIWMAP
jgi:hypothetical protein